VLDVRRLAALDLHGVKGTHARRAVIAVEFVLGFALGIGLGVSFAVVAASTGWRVFAACVAGIGLNYLPLALHAFSLLRDEALQRELAGVDVRRELRRYSALQLWIAVPLLVAVLGLVQLRRRPDAHQPGVP